MARVEQEQAQVEYDEQGDALAAIAEEQTWNDWFVEMVRKSPYFFISTCANVLLWGLAAVLMMSDARPPEKVLTTKLNTQSVQKIEPLKRDIFENKREVDPEKKPIEDAVKSDRKPDEVNETNNNEDFNQAKGDPRFNSDADLTGDLNLNAIGIGGGAGGHFGGRFGGKEDRVRSGGGSERTESAVLAALRWLKRHQSKDGSWDIDGFTSHCDAKMGRVCDGHGSTTEGDPALTGLALLAFLGAGYTHNDRSEFADTVKRALKYLVDLQNKGKDGEIATERASHSWFYGHVLATLGLSEAYGITQSANLKAPAQRAVDFMCKAQNTHPTEGGKKYGWRYQPQGADNDSSVTGWVVMALKSAKYAKLSLPADAMDGARMWFDDVTDPVYYRAGYQERGKGSAVPSEAADKFDATETCTAIAVVSRVFMEESPSSAKVKGGASLLLSSLPAWDASGRPVDYYYWYYGSLAMFQVGGDFWKKWNEAMKKALLDHQNTQDTGCLDGSWDPIDKWGGRGGRVYATAINALTLEVYYRYEKVFK